MEKNCPFLSIFIIVSWNEGPIKLRPAFQDELLEHCVRFHFQLFVFAAFLRSFDI